MSVVRKFTLSIYRQTKKKENNIIKVQTYGSMVYRIAYMYCPKKVRIRWTLTQLVTAIRDMFFVVVQKLPTLKLNLSPLEPKSIYTIKYSGKNRKDRSTPVVYLYRQKGRKIRVRLWVWMCMKPHNQQK